MPATVLARRTLPLVVLGTGLLTGRQVAAHALVLASEPAAGARLARQPARAVVRFNSRIDRDRSRLALHGPRDQVLGLKLEEARDPAILAAPLPALEPGEWRLRWQVLATDGHITRGDIAFSLGG